MGFLQFYVALLVTVNLLEQVFVLLFEGLVHHFKTGVTFLVLFDHQLVFLSLRVEFVGLLAQRLFNILILLVQELFAALRLDDLVFLRLILTLNN